MINISVCCSEDNDGFHMSGMAVNNLKQSVPSDSLYEEKSIAQLYEESTLEKLQIEVSFTFLHQSYCNGGYRSVPLYKNGKYACNMLCINFFRGRTRNLFMAKLVYRFNIYGKKNEIYNS